MRRTARSWFGIAAAFVLSSAIAVFAQVTGPQEAPPTVTLDDQLIYDGPNRGDIPKPDCIEIAPMTSSGSMTPGTWTGVSESIFSSILARTGIIPGQTDPRTLSPREEVSYKGGPGFIDLIEDSQVLNDPKDGPKARRMTFGYFVRISQTIGGKPVVREFFLLMSYDYVDAGTPGKNPAAFEVFVFGPLPTPGMYFGANPNAQLPLQDGLAVNGDGVLLPSVPTNIALVNNYKGNKVPPNTAVTPGVEEEGKGCFTCHADRAGGFPNTTAPFPWTATFGQFQAAFSTRTVKPDCPPPAASAAVLENSVLEGGVLHGVTGGAGSGSGGGSNAQTAGEGSSGQESGGVLEGAGVEPPKTNQPNRRGEEESGQSEPGQKGASQGDQPTSGKP